MPKKNAAAIPRDHIVATEFEGSEGVLVDLNAKRYYQLNETAMFIWQRLEKGKPVTEIIKELTEAYDVTSEHAAASVEKLLLDLDTHKLLQTK
jgi:hypothetical protein